MALGKTIQYTPFEETSFGYGVGEIASAHSTEFPNGTDIVKVIITPSGAHWSTATGHISTPNVGTATSAYNKDINQWRVVGERDDVDAVLAELMFFPADYPEARLWTPTEVLPNVTTGSYPMDEPSFLYYIPDTVCDLKIYDSSDILVGVYSVTWDAIDPIYGNQRPFWSTEPSIEDLSSIEYDTLTGGLVEFGTISHGSDTENVNIYCALRPVGGTTAVNTRGAFTPYDDMYVGNKIPAQYNNTYGFAFTGSVSEAQSFLDTIRYNRLSNTNKLTTEMYLKIGDGVLASEFIKYIWHSDKVLEFTTFPAQATTEETDLTLNTSGFSLSNAAEFPSTEIDEWVAEITIDSTGQSGIASCSETINAGVITLTSSTVNGLITALGNITFTFNADFKDEWSFTLDITANDTLYSLGSWSATQQTVNVTIADVPEYTIPPLTERPNLNWLEDKFRNFDTELVITDQAYGGTATYQYEGIAYWWDGAAWQPLTTADFTSTSTAGAIISGSGKSTDPLIITGSRSEVNDALAFMQMIPDLDWTTSPSVPTSGCFALHHTITRTDDSVVIAQNDVLGDETGEGYEVRTEFNPGTELDTISIPSTLYYYGAPEILGPGDEMATISYINDWVSAVTEETATYHGVTYSLSLYTHSNPDIYVNGVLIDADYMEDGYVDNQYIAVQYSWNNKTTNEINDILNGLQINNWSADFYMGITLFRSDNPSTPIFNQNTYFEYVSFPLIQSTPELFYSPQEPIFDFTYTLDEDEVVGAPVVNYINYTYSGAGTLSFHSAERKAYTSSDRKTPAVFLPEAYQYAVTWEPSNNRIKIEFNYIVSDTIDNQPIFLDEEIKIGISGLTANPVYQKIYGSRYIISREDLLRGHTQTSFSSSNLVYSYPDLFVPVSYDKPYELNKTISVVENTALGQSDGFEFVEGDFIIGSEPTAPEIVGSYVNWGEWMNFDNTFMSEAFWLIGHPNQTWATYQAAIGDPGFDHLFGVTPYDNNGTKEIVFFATDLTVSDDPATTNIGVCAAPDRISVPTGWAADSVVLDCFFDDVGLKFYALIGNISTNDWKLFSVQCNNGLVLNVVGGYTLETSGTGALSGCIGRTTENNIFVGIAYNNVGTETIDVYHSNIGWAIEDTISLTYSSSSPLFTVNLPGKANSNVLANKTGYIALGHGLYKYNTVTTTWDQLLDPRTIGPTWTDYNAINETARIALTPDYWADGWGRVYRLDTITAGTRPAHIASLYMRDRDIPLYLDPQEYAQQIQYWWGYHFNGSKHGNNFMVKTSDRTAITRISK